MEVINLDRFKTCQKVSIDGTEYEVNGTTVDQFLHEIKREASNDVEEQYTYFLGKLVEISNIPEEVLLKQEPSVLVALIQISQGIDPSAESTLEEEDSAEKK